MFQKRPHIFNKHVKENNYPYVFQQQQQTTTTTTTTTTITSLFFFAQHGISELKIFSLKVTLKGMEALRAEPQS